MSAQGYTSVPVAGQLDVIRNPNLDEAEALSLYVEGMIREQRDSDVPVVPINGYKGFDRLRVFTYHHALALSTHLGWTTAARLIAYGRFVADYTPVDPQWNTAWVWKIAVKALVVDTKLFDGAGVYLGDTAFGHEQVVVQFRAEPAATDGEQFFAKGILVPQHVGTLAGVGKFIETARRKKCDVLIDVNQIKMDEGEPSPGSVVDIIVHAKPLTTGKQWISWQAVILLWAGASAKERKPLGHQLCLSTAEMVDEKLLATSKALEEKDLELLFEKLGDTNWAAKDALSVLGLTRETRNLVLSFVAAQVADTVRSCGLRGHRFTLLESRNGARFTREDSECLMLRAPVTGSPSIGTWHLTDVARETLSYGVFLIHPDDAHYVAGDSDGDQVVVFFREHHEWLIEAAQNMGKRLDKHYASGKTSKVPTDFDLSIRGIWEAALAANPQIGSTTLQMMVRAYNNDHEQAHLWSRQLQVEVDRLKWKVKDVRGRKWARSSEYFHFRTPISALHHFKEVETTDPISKVWNWIVKERIVPTIKRIKKLRAFEPTDFMSVLKDEYLKPSDAAFFVAENVKDRWTEAWQTLYEQFPDREEMPALDVAEIRHQFAAEGAKASPNAVAALIMLSSTPALKFCYVGTRWSELCKVRQDAENGIEVAMNRERHDGREPFLLMSERLDLEFDKPFVVRTRNTSNGQGVQVMGEDENGVLRHLGFAIRVAGLRRRKFLAVAVEHDETTRIIVA